MNTKRTTYGFQIDTISVSKFPECLVSERDVKSSGEPAGRLRGSSVVPRCCWVNSFWHFCVGFMFFSPTRCCFIHCLVNDIDLDEIDIVIFTSYSLQ